MNKDRPHLLQPERVKELLTRDNPDYGKNFTETEWAEITLRIEMLTMLICRIHKRKFFPNLPDIS